jgi:hypoxanthine phosphoribosyltransferase
VRIEKVSWGDVGRLCAQLARRIREDGFAPDAIVGIGRGGWVPARLLSDLLGVRELYSMGVEYYSGPGRRRRRPAIKQDFPGSAKGMRLLVVDDVADTGGSLGLARRRLAAAREVRIATLHVKPRSRPRPDYSAKAASAWLQYPWEKGEAKRWTAGRRGVE